jgi:hypothetical protein
MGRKNQISNSGIANESGLEIFATTTTFNGEYINWGDAFSYGNQLSSDPDYTTNDVEDGAVDALVNAPNTTAGQWMRYHSDSGTNLNAAVAPTSGSGYYTFNANGNAGKPSHSGMYQKLELITGVEYQIELRTPINPNSGTLYVNTYTPFDGTFLLTSTTSIAYPVIRSHVGLVKSLFTAVTGRDVIVIYFQTTATSSTDATITDISIKEKQDYLTPIYAEDKWGNDHKVLRRNLDNTEQL